MADSKITDLSELTAPATDDVLAVVDISEAIAADKNKKIEVSNLMKGVANGSATSPSIAFQSDSNTGIYRAAADKLAITTNGTNRVTVDDSGQLLVATETANGSSKLQVNSTIYAAPYTLGNVSGNIILGQGASGSTSTVYENITTGTQNICIGFDVAETLTSGNNNIIIGIGASGGTTTEDDKVCIGESAGLEAVSGSVCVGTQAGTSNVSTGILTGPTTAIGARALALSDINNTAVGYEAGRFCQGNANTFCGHQAGKSAFADSADLSNQVNFNVGVGYQALTNNERAENCVAVGSYALHTLSAGEDSSATNYSNTAVGNKSLENATGKFNTCLGAQSGENITTGSGNIVIGDLTAAGSSAPVHTITTADNRVVMGSTAVTNAYIQVGWTTVSDERDKTNFAKVPHGLDFVTQLNPVAFQFRESRESDVAVGPMRYGFKAQEVMALEGENPVIIDNEDQNRLKYTAEGLVPVLVNAIKEQQEQIDALQARIDALEAVS